MEREWRREWGRTRKGESNRGIRRTIAVLIREVEYHIGSSHAHRRGRDERGQIHPLTTSAVDPSSRSVQPARIDHISSREPAAIQVERYLLIGPITAQICGTICGTVSSGIA